MDPIEHYCTKIMRPRISARQFQALYLHAEELLADDEIASRMMISRRSASTYLQRVADNLGTSRSTLIRFWRALREQALANFDHILGPELRRYADRHPNDVANVVGDVLVLYQCFADGGKHPIEVGDFQVDPHPWLLPKPLQQLAAAPDAEPVGLNKAKWALFDFDEAIIDIRSTVRLHVRPYDYAAARKTNDRLDTQTIDGRTLRQRYWDRALPLRSSPLANLLVAHVIITVGHGNTPESVVFARRRDDPKVMAYERGAWSATFEEQCDGDHLLSPGTHPTVTCDRSIIETALRGLDEEFGLSDPADVRLLSLFMEWANGYTGTSIMLHFDLSRHPEVRSEEDVRRVWRVKHKDREAESLQFVPFDKETLIQIVFEGFDREMLLPPPPGQDAARLHRSTPVRIYHMLLAHRVLSPKDIARIEGALAQG